MAMPYSVPAVFGTVRPRDEPIVPVARYAMYPFVFEESYPSRGKGRAKDASGTNAKPARLPALQSSLPMSARQALKAAADDAASWLALSRELAETLVGLTRRSYSPLDLRIVTAEGIEVGRAEAGAETGQFELHVKSVGRPQLNLGFDLTADASSVISPPGKHDFILRQSQSGATLMTVVLRQGETNAGALPRLCDSINKAMLGVTAFIQEDPRSGIVRLTLRARQTGTEHAFSLEDREGGSIINSIGIGRTVQPASNAVYAIDGGAVTVSATNTIRLRDGLIAVDLDQAAAVGPRVMINVERDFSPLAEQLNRVAAQVNELRAIHDGAVGRLNPTLMKRIDEVLTLPGAEAAGFRRAHDGTWRLHDEKLQAALGKISDLELKRLLAGPGGFASALEDETVRLASMPFNALINVKNGVFQAFARYGAAAEPYLQLRLSGVHVDTAL